MNRLRYWRQERGLTQIELAQAANVPRYAIQLAEESGLALHPDDVKALAETLGVTVEKLGVRMAVRQVAQASAG
jgi:transcriptional regulator with XRE-family HTH domain